MIVSMPALFRVIFWLMTTIVLGLKSLGFRYAGISVIDENVISVEALSNKIEAIIEYANKHGIDGERGVVAKAIHLSELLAGIEQIKKSVKNWEVWRDRISWLLCITAVSVVCYVVYGCDVLKSSIGLPIDFIEGVTALDALSNVSILLFLGVISVRRTFDNKCAFIVQAHIGKIHHLVHVVDMHQAIKEWNVLGAQDKTENNDKTRALDYLRVVNDIIVIAGKLPPLLSSLIDDDGASSTADRLEQLCLSLNSKLWHRYDRIKRE